MRPGVDRRDAVVVNGQQVGARREELGMTQQALASAVGRTRGYISGIENGKHPRVSRVTAKALANALQIDAAQVISQSLATENFHFPDIDNLDAAFVIDEVRRLLDAPAMSSQLRKETIFLLR